MRKKFAIFCSVFGLLSGCAETNHSDFSVTENNEIPQNSSDAFYQNSNKLNATDVSDIKNSVLATILHMSFEDNYFMEKDQKFPLISAEEKHDYTIDSLPETPSSELKNTDLESNYVVKKSVKNSKTNLNLENSAYVKCYYLGTRKGKHVVSRRYSAGGSGIFTDIIFCSIEKEKLRIDDVLMLGDRALDGIVDCPHLDSNGNLHLKMRPSISTVANLANVSDKALETGPIQSAQDFWNTSECVYDPTTKNLKIISMNINFGNELSPDLKKILESVFPNHNTIVCVDRNRMTEFLNKFKYAYQKISA